ncbi:hypothetical protein GCM10027347_58630 [Larkinella harenae]
MADLNTSYSGTVDRQDPDIVVFRSCNFNLFGACIGEKKNHYLPDPIREKIRQNNANVESTINAVKVSYSGLTPDERSIWINERLNAINERVKFIKGRTDELLSQLQSMSTDTYNSVSKTIAKALSFIPVVGTAITLISNQANTAQTLEQYKVQSLIQDYASDLQQLATIRNQLLAEVAQTGSTTVLPNEAPKVQTWYYIVGIGLLLLFFVWLRRRNKKRRKR